MMTDDQAFDAMVVAERRQLLVRLLHDDPQPVPRLSVASREILQAHERFLSEYLSGSFDVANADKDTIRAYHVHLPKLVEYGYVEWDRDAQVVTKGSEFDDVRPLVELVDAQRDRQAPAEPAPIIRE